MPRKPKQPKTISTLKHREAKRTNIPTAEYQSVMQAEDKAPVKVHYPRGAKGLEKEKEQRNRDLDPQLIWRGKDQQDWSDLVVNAPPLYIQEKVKPKVLIDDLLKESSRVEAQQSGGMADLFADFNGLPEGADKTDFYHYQGNWQNRMILGDSLQVMASLAEREGLRGKVQCIYLDPPYGIKFNSNFQWSTTSRDVKDGNAEHITREPEQVKAFRDTWRDGIHSYLTYLRDRLTVARDLLTESGSIFVQIGDENVHRVRAVMDEVFGDENFIVTISFQKTGSIAGELIEPINNYLLWYSRSRAATKFRAPLEDRSIDDAVAEGFSAVDVAAVQALIRADPLTSDGYRPTTTVPYATFGAIYYPGSDSTWQKNHWKTSLEGLDRLVRSERLVSRGSSLSYKRAFSDFRAKVISNHWTDTGGARDMIYVVQTNPKIIQRCVLMTTDPGDLGTV